MDITDALAPTSDQLDAIELVNPRTFTIDSGSRLGSRDGKTVAEIRLVGFPRVWRPSKGMLDVLARCWGTDGKAWAGRSVTLYNDPEVTFGKDKVGGIRISHLSDIDRDIQVSLTATKGKKALHTIKRMQAQSGLSAAQIADWTAAIEAAAAEELDDIKQQALDAATAVKDRDAFAAFSAAAKRRRAAVSA